MSVGLKAPYILQESELKMCCHYLHYAFTVQWDGKHCLIKLPPKFFRVSCYPWFPLQVRTGSSGKLLVKQTFYCPSLEVKQGGKRNKVEKNKAGKKQGEKKTRREKKQGGKKTRREHY